MKNGVAWGLAAVLAVGMLLGGAVLLWLWLIELSWKNEVFP